jgi:thymidylate synthase (FAD)
MNARELRHFFRIRCCRRAQWEINRMAWRMRSLVVREASHLFWKSGPDCLYRKCQEGKMTCGEEYNLEEVAEMEEWMESIEW